MDDNTTIKAIIISIVEKEVSEEMDISFDVKIFKDRESCVQEFGIDRRNFIFIDPRIGLGNIVFVFKFEKPVGELHGLDKFDLSTLVVPPDRLTRSKSYSFDDSKTLKKELDDARSQLSIEASRRLQFQHQLNEANENNRVLRKAFELFLDNVGNFDC